MTLQAALVYALLIGIFGWIVVVSVRNGRRHRRVRALIAQLKADDPAVYTMQSDGLKGEVVAINGPRRPARARCWPFVLAIDPAALRVFPVAGHEPPVVIPVERLRWFGRPQKYHYGQNVLWLHAEIDGGWQLVQLKLYRTEMQSVIRTLKEVVPPELVTAYRRRRPYVHFGPVDARPAAQDLLGAWTLDEPVSLYLTPLTLVVLAGSTVQRALALDTLQAISAIRRLDQPGTAGLVRFKVSGESLAFALDRYEVFAAALAGAAKRTLEDPVQWERKKKKPGRWDADDDSDDDSDD